MRSIAALALAVPLLIACGGKHTGDDGVGDDGGPGNPDACVGLQCQVVDCNAMGKPPTTLSGTVFAPNGTLPLFGINVYVPNEDPGPFIEGVQCDKCSAGLPGFPIAAVVTDDKGQFHLEGVPSGDNIPVVITIGKWRRQFKIAHVESCQETAVPTTDTRLPRTKAEGDIPKIAITTGAADSMECLARKLGIDDAEITTGTGPGRIHLYAGNGVNKFKAGFAGGSGQSLTGAEPFWNSLTTLKTYDIVILSCEGGQMPGTANPSPTNKSQGALDAMKGYADVGGRVFASHWHNIWVSGRFQGGTSPSPAVWNTIGTWADAGGFDGIDLIDQTANPKGMSFAKWMLHVQGSGPTTTPPTTLGQFPVVQGRATNTMINTTKAEHWVSRSGTNGADGQMFQFTTPNEIAADQRCGKVVFTDMHVSGQRLAGDYPDSCVGGANNLTLTPQEKALAFMFFDIASCVGVIQ